MGEYCSTLIVGDSGYSSLTEEEKKEFELVGLYDQTYIQKVLEDNKLATPYQERKEWTDNPKETFDFIFNPSTRGFEDLLKLSGFKNLKDVKTNIYVKTIDGITSDEFLIEETKGKKEGILFIPSLYDKDVQLIAVDTYMEDATEEMKELFTCLGKIKYEDICKDCIVETTEDQEFEIDMNSWESDEVPMNYAQLEKIYGGDFTEQITSLYSADVTADSFSEIFELSKEDYLLAC